MGPFGQPGGNDIARREYARVMLSRRAAKGTNPDL
jgi:hypothetical protein